MDYTKLTKSDIKSLLMERGVDFVSADNKDDLISLAVQSEADEPVKDSVTTPIEDPDEPAIDPQPPVAPVNPSDTKLVMVSRINGSKLQKTTVFCLGTDKCIVPLNTPTLLPVELVAGLESDASYEVTAQN